MHTHLDRLEPRQLLAADPVLHWNAILLDAIRADQTAPPYAARNMAIVHTAIYNALARINGNHEPYLGRRLEPIEASPRAAVARAAHQALSELYPDLKSTFDDALDSSLAKIPDSDAKESGLALGRKSAARILRLRAIDGADEVVTYTPGPEHDDWKPTPPTFAPAVLPQWPNVTPFAVGKPDRFMPEAPPSLTSEQFTAAFNHVKEIGAIDSTTRTDDETQIALFWADGAGTATPPGHWNRIAATVARDRDNTVFENARLFALLNIALADAGIVSWDAKYYYNFCRPITAIRGADADDNPATAADADWSPLIATPPFPSYTSGHSTFSAAAAAVLAGFFGTDKITFTSASEADNVAPRTFKSFSQAASEAGMSRIYGGIHWDFDNTAALAAGRRVGRYVVQTMLQLTQDAPAEATAIPLLSPGKY